MAHQFLIYKENGLDIEVLQRCSDRLTATKIATSIPDSRVLSLFYFLIKYGKNFNIKGL